MSLRYKALITVLLIVVAVTGGLSAYVSRLYEDAERSRIQRDLARDAQRLRDILKSARETTESALTPSLKSKALLRTVNLTQIKNNFDDKTKAWTKLTRSDIAVAAIDSFVAEERMAIVQHQTKNLAICSLHSRSDLGRKFVRTLVTNPALERLMEECFKTEKTQLAIFGSGGRVYYAVATPFSESNQDWVPVGVAVVLVELSDKWVRAHRPEGESNPIEQVLFMDKGVLAKTIMKHSVAEDILNKAMASDSPTFEITIPVNAVDERFIGLRQFFDKSGKGPGFIAFKSLDRALAPLYALQRNVLIGGAVLAVLGLLVAYGIAFLLIKRIDRLREATTQVRKGNFDTHVEIRGKDELSMLAKDFNDMVTGLKALGLYTDPEIARKLLESDEVLNAEGSREEGSIFFCDVKDFTSITESMDEKLLIEQLNTFFTRMGYCIKQQDGYLDKFIGDAVMAFWGPPFLSDKDFARRACRAALACHKAVCELNEAWKKEGRPVFIERIGIATGASIVGNIGSKTKKNFTVIGDPVNLASRLEGTNKVYGTHILVDHRTHEQAGDEFLFREIDQIRVKGKTKPERVYELMAIAAEADDGLKRLAKAYGKALMQYRSLEFEAAIKTLTFVGGGDGPSQWMLKQCAHFKSDPPDDNWTGITKMREK